MDEKLKEAILIIINSISPMYSEIRLSRDDVQRLKEIANDLKGSEDKCKNCEYYRNPDYTRCHECKAGKRG